jgi:hypothetical protein
MAPSSQSRQSFLGFTVLICSTVCSVQNMVRSNFSLLRMSFELFDLAMSQEYTLLKILSLL